MYFLYLKSNGVISPPVKRGKPDDRSLNKKADCGMGSGVKWNANDLFYASDEEFPDDFARTASLGKYYVDGNEIKENLDWEEPPEEER